MMLSPAELIKRQMLEEQRNANREASDVQEKIRWEQFFNEVGEFRQKYIQNQKPAESAAAEEGKKQEE